MIGITSFNFSRARQFKSTPYSDIQLPKFVTDPLYTSSQGELDKLGTGLITGDGIPDYYKSIGDFNSPQFQAMLNSVKGQTMQASQEASAINGTGRSGVAVTASNNALNNILPHLTYADYTRAMAGRGALLDTGIDVKGGVRASAQQQGLNESNFNQMLFQDQMNLAGANDNWKKDAAASTGAFWGNVGSLIGGQDFGNLFSSGITAGAGGAPSSAWAGGSGSFSSLSSLFSSLGNLNLGGPSATGVNGASGGTAYGLADQLGSFDPGSLSSFGESSALPLAAMAI